MAAVLLPATSAQAEGGYYKYPWSNCIYFHLASGSYKHVDYGGWVLAGKPTPTVVTYLPGGSQYVFHNATSPDEIFAAPRSLVRANGEMSLPASCTAAHKYTYAQWVAAGSPAAANTGKQIVQVAGEDTIYLRFYIEVNGVVNPDPEYAPYTYAQWVSIGRPTPLLIAHL